MTISIMQLIEIEPNYFINADHIVDLRYSPGQPPQPPPEIEPDGSQYGESYLQIDPRSSLRIKLLVGSDIVLQGEVADSACRKLGVTPASTKPIGVAVLTSTKSEL